MHVPPGRFGLHPAHFLTFPHKYAQGKTDCPLPWPNKIERCSRLFEPVDGLFSLDRLASFLRQAPLGLRFALNLDGGPIACQGISLDGFERRACGKWEIRADDSRVRALVYNSRERPTLSIVLAAFPK